MEKYSWFFFDADDTLFDFKRSAEYAFTATLRYYEIKLKEDHYEIYKGINHEVWLAFEKKQITALELRKLRFERFLDAIGEYRDPLEMNAHYLNELSQTDFLIEGARSVIEELLEANKELVLITNGLKEVQRARIRRANMESYFRAIIVSDEIGVAKPHKGFFDKAFRDAGQPHREEVLVIGDSLSSDIQGGNNYGVDTCWFNPSGATNLTGHEPTYQIEKLVQIKDLGPDKTG